MKHVLLLISGWVLLLLGIVIFPIPIIPWFLILGGLSILSRESQAIKGLLDRLKARYPRHYARLARFGPRREIS